MEHIRAGALAPKLVGASLFLLAASSCSPERQAAPDANQGGSHAGVELVSEGSFVLASGPGLTRSAALRPDSANEPVTIARLRVRGVTGDTIALVLGADASVLAKAGHQPVVIATIDGRVIQLASADLVRRTAFFKFPRADSLELEYRLHRAVLPHGADVNLVHHSSGSTESLLTPWAPSGQRITTQAGPGGTSCALGAANGTCSSVTWSINPYAPGYVFPGFQSDSASTGPSRDITIVFSSQVSSFTAKAYDPTWSGNRIVAYNGSTIVASAEFAGSGQPGQNIPSTRSVSGAITKVVLVPAPNDYVTYEATIIVDSKVRLNISCLPSPVTRTATVTCTATLSNGKAFNVLLATSDAPDGSTIFVSGTAINGGKGWQTQGPALFQTVLAVSVTSSGVSYTANRNVEVVPRVFPSINFPALPTELKAPNVGDFKDFAALPFTPMQWGEHSGPELDTLALGMIPIVVASSGPSIGFAAIGSLSSIPLKRPIVKLNVTLYREGIFYHDQNGTDGISTTDPESGRPYCNNAIDPGWLDRVRAFVVRHEGITGAANSHHGLWIQAFQTYNPQGAMESLLFRDTAIVQSRIKDLLSKSFENWAAQKSIEELHKPLDASEGTKAAFDAAAGCALDRDISIERGQ